MDRAADAHLGVIGPRSREVVRKLTDADVGALRYFRFLPEPVKVAGVEVYLSRTGYGGELGFELFLTDPSDAEELWNAVVGAGATPFGAEAIELARVEAGLIVTDYDYEAHQRTPYDFNLDRLRAAGRAGRVPGKESAPRRRGGTAQPAGDPALRGGRPARVAPPSPRAARRSACSRARPRPPGSEDRHR